MSTYTDEYDEKRKNHCQNLYSRMNEEQRQIQRDLINDVLEREGHLPEELKIAREILDSL